MYPFGSGGAWLVGVEGGLVAPNNDPPNFVEPIGYAAMRMFSRRTSNILFLVGAAIVVVIVALVEYEPGRRFASARAVAVCFAIGYVLFLRRR